MTIESRLIVTGQEPSWSSRAPATRGTTGATSRHSCATSSSAPAAGDQRRRASSASAAARRVRSESSAVSAMSRSAVSSRPGGSAPWSRR